MATRARLNWTEYVIEASALASFMVSATACAALLYHPASAVAMAIQSEWIRRSLMGLAMGLTAVAIIYSPAGQRSGAHMNPAVTMAFFRLGKIRQTDAGAYIAAHFIGAVLGLVVISQILPSGMAASPPVHYVTTLPGPSGQALAFMAECAISFLLMACVLLVSNTPRAARYTGLCAGGLVWIYITLESPLSGMSMNPARTMGSALMAADFRGLWIYFTAPPIGMLLAAELFVRRYGLHQVACAKLHHPHTGTCHFACSMKPQLSEDIKAS
ncbi:MAG: aquaporin [Vicinamibacterales bacterium]